MGGAPVLHQDGRKRLPKDGVIEQLADIGEADVLPEIEGSVNLRLL
jgi:hypothetical protein